MGYLILGFILLVLGVMIIGALYEGVTYLLLFKKRKLCKKYPLASKIIFVIDEKNGKSALSTGLQISKSFEYPKSYWKNKEKECNEQASTIVEATSIIERYGNGYRSWLLKKQLQNLSLNYMNSKRIVEEEYKIREYEKAYKLFEYYHNFFISQGEFCDDVHSLMYDPSMAEISDFRTVVFGTTKFGTVSKTNLKMVLLSKCICCADTNLDYGRLERTKQISLILPNLLSLKSTFKTEYQEKFAQAVNSVISYNTFFEEECLIVTDGEQLYDDSNINYQPFMSALSYNKIDYGSVDDIENLLDLKLIVFLDFVSTTEDFQNKCSRFIDCYNDRLFSFCKNKSELKNYSIKILCVSIIHKLTKEELIELKQRQDNEK